MIFLILFSCVNLKVIQINQQNYKQIENREDTILLVFYPEGRISSKTKNYLQELTEQYEIDIFDIKCTMELQEFCLEYVDFIPHYRIQNKIRSLDLNGNIPLIILYVKIQIFLQEYYRKIDDNDEASYQFIESSLKKYGQSFLYNGEFKNKEDEESMDYVSYYYNDLFKSHQIINSNTRSGSIQDKFGIELAQNSFYIIQTKEPHLIEIDKNEEFFYQYKKIQYKALIKLNEDVFNKTFVQNPQNDQFHIFYFEYEHCKEEEKNYFHIMFDHQKELEFLIYEISEYEQPEFTQKMKNLFGMKDKCNFIIAKKTGGYNFQWLKYYYDGKINYIQPFTFDHFEDYLERFRDGRLDPYYKIKMYPESDEIHINNKELSFMQQNSSFQFFVLFYSNESLNSEYTQNFLKIFGNFKNVNYFLYNMDENDPRNQIDNDPSLYYFNDVSSDGIRIKDEITEENILNNFYDQQTDL